ncbi:restriction endonuclease subunit S [Synechocystis sp. LEGE 06083]|uniref:restriction endonuclease subunit S n=1 Tax=Synechocystis sp. LEGE 06083 TaxID=915336 RepID=UPI00187E1454|nr:restriction endonuclease subunit S [Synechocystis sp. LEGE 06083]MBE9197108.1 restriction endonuclease subunit S [Synechocystis sp. LEGE 06083]
MKLKPYPEYKDSGVLWLGKIPAHWNIMPLKHWVFINQSVLNENTDPDFRFNYIDIGAVSTGKLVSQPRIERFADSPSRARRVIKAGDTLLSTVRTYLKAVYHCKYINKYTVASTGFAVLTPKNNTDPGYVGYVGQSELFINQIVARSIGVAYPAISETELGRCLVWFPTLKEQTQIANFLDWKTTQINKFIRNKQRLIELLKEQKQNIINQAVTRGLDPNVKLKPSGVELIGDIPEHWKTARLFQVSKVVDPHPSHRNPPLCLDGIPFLGVGDLDIDGNVVRAGYSVAEDIFCEQNRRFQIEDGDLAIGRVASVGKIVRLKPIEICLSGRLAVIKPFTVMFSTFLFYSLQVAYITDQILTGTDLTTLGVLGLNKLKRLVLIIPPKYEQKAITDFINTSVEPIDEAITRAEREIELMREYRTRLISDVVTGQVDVRDIEVPEVVEEELFDMEEDPSEVMDDELEAGEEE